MTDLMKAVVVGKETGEVDHLRDAELPKPEVGDYDILVEPKAAALNPIDTRMRTNGHPANEDMVLGYDCAGVIVRTGTKVDDLSVGDEVFFAGNLFRNGAVADFVAVDHRLAARKPEGLSFVEAAALPLTSITAYECLFEKLGLDKNSSGSLLILGGAGGVGSMAIQLASQLTDVEVVATASSDDSTEWCLKLGADRVVNHREDLVEQLGESSINWILSPFSKPHFEVMKTILKPYGEIVAIDNPTDLDWYSLKSPKSLSWHWEFMFTRPLAGGDIQLGHKEILDTVSKLIGEGNLESTIYKRINGFDAAAVREGHKIIETEHSIGKVVLER